MARFISYPVALVSLLLLLLASLAGCADDAARVTRTTSTKYGGQLNYFLGEPVSIDPAFVQESEGLQVVKELFDGPVDYDPETMEVVPAVAESWRSNAAGDRWTFWLRQGVRFHNGREVTARDFIYAWNRVAAKKTASPVAYHMAPIKGFDDVQRGRTGRMKGLSVAGRYVLKIKLNYPFADFPVILGHPVFSPVPGEAVGAGKFADKPVGNGPFMMDGPWRHQQSIALKRFPRYYKQSALLSGVNFKIADNQQTAFLEFRGGALHYAAIPSGQIRATVTQNPDNAIVGRPQLILQFYGFNLARPPFNKNVKLRQAINYAINRPVIADKIYEGAYAPAGGIVPPGLAGYHEPRGAYTYSPKKAAGLLKEAGFPKGRGLPRITLIYPTGRGSEGPAQVVQENLRDLGINIEIEGLEFGSFINALRSGKMSMFAANWQADYPSRDTFLYQLFYSESGDNVFGFANAKVDRLLMEARQSIDLNRRRRLYEQAEEEILKQAPIVPLAFAGSRAIHAPTVKNFVRTALDDTPLDRVWLTK